MVEFLSCGWIGLGGEVTRRMLLLLLLLLLLDRMNRMEGTRGGRSGRNDSADGIVRWRWVAVGDGRTAPDRPVNGHGTRIQGR